MAFHGLVWIYQTIFYFVKGRKVMENAAALTAAELEEIREYNRQRNRAWWGAMSADEKKARRQRYALTQARRKQAQQAAAQDDDQTSKKAG